MPTQVDLSKVSRRDIRYVLFCLQNNTELVKSEHQELVATLEKFMTDNHVSLPDFGIKWDLGIDTVDTMHMRPESWWLWGISHTTVVQRPVCSADIVGGLGLIHSYGFGEKGRKVPFNRADYQQILEQAATRKGWV